jgi:serine/threonine protein kinase
MVGLEKGNVVTAKIIDLGLSKTANEPGSCAAISTPREFVGTPEFASPERFAGVSVDIRSDPYSLGRDALEDADSANAFPRHIRRADVPALAITVSDWPTGPRQSASIFSPIKN